MDGKYGSGLWVNSGLIPSNRRENDFVLVVFPIRRSSPIPDMQISCCTLGKLAIIPRLFRVLDLRANPG